MTKDAPERQDAPERARLYYNSSFRKRGASSEMRTCLVVITGGKYKAAIVEQGPGDAHKAEWLALLGAVRYAKARKLVMPRLMGDNQSVVLQALGHASITPLTQPFVDQLKVLADSMQGFDLSWVRQGNNLAGRFLEGGATNAFREGLRMLEGI